jgi:hypothetical protein
MLTEERKMGQIIDLEDSKVIEALNKAGWVKINEDDIVISRSVLNSLIFDADLDKDRITENLNEK